jgi:hypothetical protein
MSRAMMAPQAMSMAQMKSGSVCAPGGDPNQGDIARYLGELLKLSPGELRAVGIGLSAVLGTTRTTDRDSYKVPGDADLVIYQVGAYWRSTLIATEPVLNANFTQFGPTDLMVARLQNCLATLTNKDRSLAYFDAGAVPLSSLAPPAGAPQFLPPMAPYLVPSGITLEASFTLQDTTAAVVGNNAEYGLILGGFLIPKRA